MFNVKTEDTFYDGNHKIVNEVIQANPQSKPHRYQALKNYVNSLTCFKLTPLMLSLLPWSADHSSGLTGRAFSPTMVCPSWQFSQWALSRPWFVVSTLQLNWNSFWGPRSLSASLPPLFCGPADSSRAMLCYAYPGYGTPTTPLPRLLPCPGINKPVSTTQKNLLVVMGMCLGMQMNGMMSLLFLIWKFLALFLCHIKHILMNQYKPQLANEWVCLFVFEAGQ